MYCKNCGNPFEGRFCPNCGTPADQPQAPSTPAPPAEHVENYAKPVTKRWWFWALIVLTAIVLVLSLTNKDDKKKAVVEEQVSPVESTVTEEQAEESEEPASLLGIGSAVLEAAAGETEEPVGDVTIEEQVVLDEQGVRITVLSLDLDSWFGPTINLLIENNADKNLTVQARNCSVNGAMMDPYFSCDVAAGKKANGELSFSSTDFSDAGIQTLKSIELVFYVYETDTYDEVFSSSMVTIASTAPASFEQTFDASGTEVLNTKGIRFVILGLDESDPVWGSSIHVYAENNSTRNITVQLTDVSVNGYMIDPYFYSALLIGKVAYDRVTFFQTDLDDNHITSIESLEFRIHVYDSETWDTIFDSDVISLTFE